MIHGGIFIEIHGGIFTEIHGRVFTEIHGEIFTEIHGEFFHISVNLCASLCLSVFLCVSLCLSVFLCVSLCHSPNNRACVAWARTCAARSRLAPQETTRALYSRAYSAQPLRSQML